MAALTARSSFFFSRSAAFCAHEAAGTGLGDSTVVQGRARGRCAVAASGGGGVAAAAVAAAAAAAVAAAVAAAAGVHAPP